MKIDIDDGVTLDDLKVKNYNHDLARFLHTKRKIPNEITPVERENDIIDSVADGEITQRKHKSAGEAVRRPATGSKSVKRKRKTLSIPPTSGRITRLKRVRRTPKKFDWEEW